MYIYIYIYIDILHTYMSFRPRLLAAEAQGALAPPSLGLPGRPPGNSAALLL